jgi:RNA polymerase sigma factor (sigma-70 family)
MAGQNPQTEQFERQRPKLRALAYRMLGSVSEADDAVQEAWLRLNRSGDSVDNLGGWLTTVVGRVCLDMLRARRSRREDLVGAWLPEPIVSVDEPADPEQETLLADAVGVALLVVLETLTPRERLAFVLHDMFGMPFEEIALIVDRSPATARQLASRARRRVRGRTPEGEPDVGRQRQVIDAFIAAAREGDFDALVAVLDPDIVLRADGGPGVPAGASLELHGAETVASRALTFSRMDLLQRPALINGAAGVVSLKDGKPFSIGAVTVRDGRIIELDFVSDPELLARIDLTILETAS